MNKITPELVSNYMRREPALAQISAPVCSDSETMLVLTLLKIATGEKPKREHFLTQVLQDREVYEVKGLALRKTMGIKTLLILTGQFAGFMLWTRHQKILRPILASSILKFIPNDWAKYQHLSEFNKLVQNQPINDSGISATSIDEFLFTTFEKYGIQHNPNTMSRNIHAFQELVDQRIETI